MIKLRCIEVKPWSKVLPGDICLVTEMVHETNNIVAFSPEGRKFVAKFRYTVKKEILFEGSTFRLQCPLP
jgi:hypothetical protein